MLSDNRSGTDRALVGKLAGIRASSVVEPMLILLIVASGRLGYGHHMYCTGLKVVMCAERRKAGRNICVYRLHVIWGCTPPCRD